MTTPTNNSTTELKPDEARQATVERPVFNVLIASLVLAAIAAIVLAVMFSF